MDSILEEFLFIYHENNIFFERLKFSLIAESYTYLRDTGTEMVFEGANFKSIIDKVIGWLKHAKEKIKELFDKFMNLFRKKGKEAIKQAKAKEKQNQQNKNNSQTQDDNNFDNDDFDDDFPFDDEDKDDKINSDKVILQGPSKKIIDVAGVYDAYDQCYDYLKGRYEESGYSRNYKDEPNTVQDFKEYVTDEVRKDVREITDRYLKENKNTYSKYEAKHSLLKVDDLLEKSKKSKEKIMNSLEDQISSLEKMKSEFTRQIDAYEKGKSPSSENKENPYLDYKVLKKYQSNILNIIEILKEYSSVTVYIYQEQFKVLMKAQQLAIKIINTK